jgi:hypothetical protein
LGKALPEKLSPLGDGERHIPASGFRINDIPSGQPN